MASQVIVYNPAGFPLTDLDVSTIRSWTINEIGDCAFDISINDPKATQAYLQFGNIVYVQHDKLPDWVGFISDDPEGRHWEYGVIKVMCSDAKKYFSWRGIQYGQYVMNVEDQFRNIVRMSQRPNTGLNVLEGDILRGGRTLGYEGGMQASEALDLLVEHANVEWTVTPKIAQDGRLELYANLYERKKSGKYIDMTLDESNTKAIARILSEVGPIYNDVAYMSRADTYNSRIFGNKHQDLVSIGKYGLREFTDENEAVTVQGLDEAAKDFLAEHSEPRRTVPMVLLDVGNTYNYSALGNRFTWQSAAGGFGDNTGIGSAAEIQIAHMEYADETNELQVELELLQDTRERIS